MIPSCLMGAFEDPCGCLIEAFEFCIPTKPTIFPTGSDCG
jgi:hypothetical protein